MVASINFIALNSSMVVHKMIGAAILFLVANIKLTDKAE
jgi:hypothetical protein